MPATLEQRACSLAADSLIAGRAAYDAAADRDDSARDTRPIPSLADKPASAARARHKVEYRVSINTLFWGRFYFTLFAGPERRSRERLDQEGQTSIPRQAVLVSVVVATMLSFSVFGLFCSLYLLKAVMRLNLFQGASPFHPLYELFLRG